MRGVSKSYMVKLPTHSTDRPKGFKVTMYGSSLIRLQSVLCEKTIRPLVKCWCSIKDEYPQ